MKKIVLLALAASTAAIATPAFAVAVDDSAVGTINIIGSVASKCSVGTGSDAGTTWGTDIDMGELSDADGTLLPSATLAATFNTKTGANRIARVVCTTLNPSITVQATPLTNAATPVTGYVKTVHFQADVLVDKAVNADQTYSDDSLVAAATGPTALGDALAASGNNVTITTSNWRTISNSGQQMIAGAYTGGKIVVTISPI